MLSCLPHSVLAFLHDEDGPTAVEYAVMLSLIVVVCISAITLVGGNANGTFSNARAALGSKSGGSGGSSGSSGAGTTFEQGAAVSSGTYTIPWGAGSDIGTYDATTGKLTVATASGDVIASSQGTPGKLPNVKAGYVWTQK